MCKEMKVFPPYSQISENQCCGCEVCVNVCPIHIIHMKQDNEGFYFPVFDKEKCINCRKCEKFCPLIKENKAKMIDNKILLKAYAGSNKNMEIVRKSSSGGIFSQIAEVWYNRNPDKSYIVGVEYTDDFRGTRHIVISNLDDIDRIRRSKYVQSRKYDIYLKVKHLLEEDNMVLFVGTPCEVAGLLSFLGEKKEKLLTVDIICQGPTSPKVLEQYVNKMEKKYNSKVKQLNMRYKEGVWIPQYLKIDFKSGKGYKNLFYDTEIGYALHVMQRKSCYSCEFINENRKSDITIGDFHGADKNQKYYNELGTSVVIANTEFGQKFILNYMQDNLVEVDYETIAHNNIRLTKTWEPLSERKKFSNYMIQRDIFYAMKKARRESILLTIRRKLPIELKIRILKWMSKRNAKVSM